MLNLATVIVRVRLVLTIWIGAGMAWPVVAGTLYVAPDGDPAGIGSIEYPLDLITAIGSNSPARPGDTLLLRGGRYEAPREGDPRTDFGVQLRGAPDQPIVITSAPGEWAHLHGGVDVADAQYVHFIRLEIGDADWTPSAPSPRTTVLFNAWGGVGLKLINCNLFGGARGVCLWTPAVDFEAYGNLIHDFGDTRDSLGRAFYMQNDEGTKLIQRNIAWRSTHWLYGMYTQQGRINGFDLIENIGFMAGHHKAGEAGYGISLIGYQPAERIRVIGNITYQPRHEQQWRSNVRLTVLNLPEPVHRDAVITDNVFMGGYRALCLGRWERLVMTNNTLWASGFLTEINSAPTGSNIPDQDTRPDLSGFHVDGNTYYASTNDRPFIYGRAEITRDEDQLTFAEWQALGLDRNSRLLSGEDGKPTGTHVFAYDNAYEPGRGHIAVFNWDGLEHVEANLGAILAVGQRYCIYNCQDIRQTIAQATPVLRSVFDGRPVRLPMRKAPEAPDFDAFLVLPETDPMTPGTRQGLTP